MAKRRWRIRLGGEAERDFHAIILWTAETFGGAQAAAYQTTLLRALRAIAADPFCIGSKARDADIGAGYRTLHVARAGRKGRHLILYRADSDTHVLIVRILHDAMEVSHHLPGN